MIGGALGAAAGYPYSCDYGYYGYPYGACAGYGYGDYGPYYGDYGFDYDYPGFFGYGYGPGYGFYGGRRFFGRRGFGEHRFGERGFAGAHSLVGGGPRIAGGNVGHMGGFGGFAGPARVASGSFGHMSGFGSGFGGGGFAGGGHMGGFGGGRTFSLSRRSRPRPTLASLACTVSPPDGDCADAALRTFGSLVEVRRAHARCDPVHSAEPESPPAEDQPDE